MKAEVNSFVIENKKVYYNIRAQDGNTRWQLSKRFSEFDLLNEDLEDYFGKNLPPLPQKSYLTIFTGKTEAKIEKRREGLDDYLKSIVTRNEIVHSVPFRNFLDVDAKTQKICPPQMIIKFQDFMYEITDFQINFELGMMFILHSDSSIAGRLDAYLSNYKMPWYDMFLFRDQCDREIPIGCLECWVQSDSEFEKTWIKTYRSQAICCHWNNDTVFVGLEDGHINMVRLNMEKRKIEESFDIESHTDRVRGIHYDGTMIHSVSKDGSYRVVNYKTSQLHLDTKPSKTELTYLHLCEKREKSFVSDKNGQIFIYDINKLVLVAKFQSQSRDIRGISIDSARGYLFIIGYENSYFSIIDINQPGQESLIKQISYQKCRSYSCEIAWSFSRGEIFIGNKDGSITIWCAKKKSPIYIIKGHQGAITKLVWIESESTLMSGGKDKIIKAWRLPRVWGERYDNEQTIGLRFQDQDDL